MFNYSTYININSMIQSFSAEIITIIANSLVFLQPMIVLIKT